MKKKKKMESDNKKKYKSFFIILDNEIGSWRGTKCSLEQKIQIKKLFLIIRGFVLMAVK